MTHSRGGPAFEVHPYSLERLIQLAARLSPANTEDVIAAKSHPRYLDSYFTHLKVKTIVVERRYVDRDYLEDFAAYYVRCFHDYDRHCARLHFFTQSFDESAFTSYVAGTAGEAESDAFKKAYCGFVVIKPLPLTVFGRTCLTTYPESSPRKFPLRVFPVTREYHANLFGIPLTIPATLPFQEQDNVIAACATSALWSALQATAREFQHQFLTPIDVTRAAVAFLPADSRMIPNRNGLSTSMMAEAVRTVDLEPSTLELRDDFVILKANLYAYLRARIPIILGVRLRDTAPNAKPADDHAIAVTGYKLTEAPADPLPESAFRLRATRIEKIYVHDDQVGPFARMTFDDARVNVELDGKHADLQSLSTSWRSADGSYDKVRAVPLLALIPLYHKIRIPFEDVLEHILHFHAFLRGFPREPGKPAPEDFEWDIHLTQVNDFKEDLRQSTELNAATKLRWLTEPMPRFLWRATAECNGARIIDILFDATDIHTSDGVHAVILYNADFQTLLGLLSANPDIERLPDIEPGAIRILRWLRQHAAAASGS
jgi:hypothetical protein